MTKQLFARRACAPALVRGGACAAALVMAASAAIDRIPQAEAGSFTFAGAANGVDVIVHPVGYTGATLLDGFLRVTVGVAKSALFSDGALQDIVDAINIWNTRKITVGNVRTGAATPVPVTAVDFETAALHQFGHALGLADFNDPQDFARADPGANGVLDQGAGADGLPGTLDDVRGDDASVTWSVDPTNPFTDPPTPTDATTMWRADTVFPTLGRQEVATALAFPNVPANTESVMISGPFLGEDQRSLTSEDIAMLRLAEAGADGFAGGADDYVVQLIWVGEIDATPATENVGIFIDINPTVAFATTLVDGVFLQTPAIGVGTHIALTDADVFFNPAQPWFTGQPRDCNSNLTPDIKDIASGVSLDTNGDGIPDECQCASDLDNDLLIGPNDLLLLLSRWDRPFGPSDLLAMLASWGVCNPFAIKNAIPNLDLIAAQWTAAQALAGLAVTGRVATSESTPKRPNAGDSSKRQPSRAKAQALGLQRNTATSSHSP